MKIAAKISPQQILLLLILLISVVGLISGCKNEPPKNDDAVLAQKNFEPRKPTDPPLNVLATGMIADAVRKVGGDSIKVNALMGQGLTLIYTNLTRAI